MCRTLFLSGSSLSDYIFTTTNSKTTYLGRRHLCIRILCSAWSRLSLWMLWMDQCTGGRAASQPQVYIRIRSQTMWEPMCPRMQMPLTGRDGLCDEGLNCMRTERGATEAKCITVLVTVRRQECWGKTKNGANLSWQWFCQINEKRNF